MALSQQIKSEVIKKFQTREGDTGSPEVQIALLTERIKQLTSDANCKLSDPSCAGSDAGGDDQDMQ